MPPAFEIRRSRVHTHTFKYAEKHTQKTNTILRGIPDLCLHLRSCYSPSCCQTNGSLPSDLLLASSGCTVHINLFSLLLYLTSTSHVHCGFAPLFSYLHVNVFLTESYQNTIETKHNHTGGLEQTCEYAGRKVSDTMQAIRAEVFVSVCLWYGCIGNGVLVSCIPC